MSTHLEHGYRIPAGTHHAEFLTQVKVALDPVRDRLDARRLAVGATTAIDTLIGPYDGQGGVGITPGLVGEDHTVWHLACWLVAGKPLDYRGASKTSADQGWFFTDGVHNKVDPTLVLAL